MLAFAQAEPLAVSLVAGFAAPRTLCPKNCPIHGRQEFFALDASDVLNVRAVLGRDAVSGPLANRVVTLHIVAPLV